MSDAGHSSPDQTSPFEFKLSKALDGSTSFPVNGKYQGWFFLKQPPPFKGLKIEDKDMILKFVKVEDNGYKVEGNGHNRFGTFSLYGTLSSNGDIQLYREYAPKVIPGKKSSVADSKIKSTSVQEDLSAREGSGRLRKVSTAMKDYEDSLFNKPKAASVPKPIIEESYQSIESSSYTQVSTGGRSQRLPPAIVKCTELLKEMMKYPQSIWFLEPVDHIKLGIPDYVKIITKPMDFGTISKNIEKGVYETPDQFAEHMRLVFRNAITYNQMRDHPVHVAARELNAKFEDKFRALLSHLSSVLAGANALANALDTKVSRQSSITSSASKKGRSSRVVGNNWNKSRPASVGGGRFDSFLPPVVDVGSASLIDMQRRMQEMADELASLRTVVRQTEVKSNLDSQR
jgi:Bromodomain